MIHAYNELYLDKAQVSLGTMLDFAVNTIHYKIGTFMDLFIGSGNATLFESGNPETLVGRSGIELVYDTLEKSNLNFNIVDYSPVYERSREYWAGWALAFYQWQSSMSFSSINRSIPIETILSMYSAYHEMDVLQFCDHMNKLIQDSQPETNLKRYRTMLGFSQSQLANASGVPVRTIQQYEQRQKNINKAQVDYLIRLSSALNCEITALVEKI